MEESLEPAERPLRHFRKSLLDLFVHFRSAVTLSTGVPAATAVEVTSKGHDIRAVGKVLEQNHNDRDAAAYDAYIQLDDAISLPLAIILKTPGEKCT